MHIIALALLALVLGGLYMFLQPKLAAVVPSNLQQGKIAGAFFTGAFILVAFFIASFVLHAFGMRTRA